MVLTQRLGNHVAIFKSIDESIDSSTTLHNDGNLKFPMSANETWKFEFVVLFTTAATPDFKMTINGPDTPRNLRAYINIWNAAGTTLDIGDVITAYDTEVEQTVGSVVDSVGYIYGVVENGATAGNLVLRWAQRNNNSSATTVKRGSYLVAHRIRKGSEVVFLSGVAGREYSYGLGSDGSAWSWGKDGTGALGNGVASTSVPTSVVGDHSFIEIASCNAEIGGVGANGHFVGLKADGSVWTCGDYNQGVLGVSGVINRSSPVSVVGNHSFVGISPTNVRVMAIKSNGSVWGWGNGGDGRLGQGTSIADRSSPVSVIGAHSFASLFVGGSSRFSLALKSDGSAWGWGGNGFGGIGDSSTSNRSSPVSVVGGHSFDQISAGFLHSIGLKSDGSAWGWGRNNSGAIGDNTNTDKSSPVSITGGHSFIAIYAGPKSSRGLKADGSAWGWGSNGIGELGDNTGADRSSPISTVGAHSFTSISAGGTPDPGPNGHTAASKSDGSVWCWGYGTDGRLGDDTSTHRSSPVSVIAPIILG